VDDKILFDCGMGTVKQLERLKLQVKNIKCLVISHYHADHFFDIPNLLMGKKIRKECSEKLYIILPVGGRRKVIDMLEFSFGAGDINAFEDIEEKYNVEFIELQKDSKYIFENYEITAIGLKHGNCIPTYGYLLKNNNTILGYTGDTGITDNFFRMCEIADYMLVDTTWLNPINNDNHISFEDLKEYAKKYTKCKFFAVHRGDYEVLEKRRC
jgi:ribonuclease BN (tRNA processing enzyme)